MILAIDEPLLESEGFRELKLVWRRLHEDYPPSGRRSRAATLPAAALELRDGCGDRFARSLARRRRRRAGRPMQPLRRQNLGDGGD
jgi:hypothetical protein